MPDDAHDPQSIQKGWFGRPRYEDYTPHTRRSIHNGQQRHLEITAIDAYRWAVLHLPLAGLFSILFLWHYFANEVRHGFESIVVILVGVPFIFVCVFIAALFQAYFINLFMSLMGRGPILRVRDTYDSGGSDI